MEASHVLMKKMSLASNALDWQVHRGQQQRGLPTLILAAVWHSSHRGVVWAKRGNLLVDENAEVLRTLSGLVDQHCNMAYIIAY